jgi:hypothetical protein
LMLLKEGDVIYLALKGTIFPWSLGEDFNYKAILDDYDIMQVLGVGGFGRVLYAKSKDKGNEVAIKYMDISEQCKAFYQTHEISATSK